MTASAEQHPRFFAALRALGPTYSAQARAIGVTPEAVRWWWTGERMPTTTALRGWPAGLRALADDFEALNDNDRPK